MTTIFLAFKRAGVPVMLPPRVKWPRKRHNRYVGIQRDVKTGERLRRVN